MKQLLLQISAALCLFSAAASANVSIVATVDGDPITSFEVEQRVALLAYATDIAVTDENRQRVRDDALQMLIDDSLKRHAALKINPDVQAAALGKANEALDQNFSTETESGSRALRDIGIDPMTVQAKYTSDILWADFLRSQYSDKFAALDTKVESELQRLTENASQPQLKLSEIVLTPAPNRNLEQTKKLANEMVAAVRKGANFNAIAQQYSVAGSAQQGGRIGWVVTAALPSAFAEAIAIMDNGAVTEPIELDGAIYIFRREGEREKGFADESQSRVWLARAIIVLPADASNADRLEAGAKIERDTETVSNCDDLEALNKAYGSNAVSRLEEMVLGDLAPQMQKLIKSLKDNQPSEPIAFDEGIAAMMVCRREAPKLNLPSPDEIRRVLFDKLFGALSERHLLRLRRSAVIDIRG